jgi:hypothetical protein
MVIHDPRLTIYLAIGAAPMLVISNQAELLSNR